MVRAALLPERGGADVLVMGCDAAYCLYSGIRRFVRVSFLSMLEKTARAAREEDFHPSGCLRLMGLSSPECMRGSLNAGALAW